MNKNKPKSSRIFLDENITISAVRTGILKGTGIPEEELFGKPFIGVANSWTELNPGHRHLNKIAEAVKDGIRSAGGVPFEFNVPAPCDGIAMGNEGMKYILVQRDLIADMVEAYVRSQWFDGLVIISSCDKINPGLLMAGLRVDIPLIYVPGGCNTWAIRYSKGYKGSIDNKDYEELSQKILTTTGTSCGACEVMGTANTFQCLIEGMGLALPDCASIPVTNSLIFKKAYLAGKRIVEMVSEDLKPSRIINKNSIENAIVIDLAIGGSTNTTLHLPAIAHSTGMEFDLKLFNEFNRRVPTILSIYPNGPHGMVDFFNAGGLPGVLKQLRKLLHTECITVSGRTLNEIIEEAEVYDEGVIRPVDKPYFHEGGTVILYGNLAPEGAVVKQSAVKEDMRIFKGRAIVCNGEEEALSALQSGRVKDGNVLVIRYEGPKGGPGMPEMLAITNLIEFMGLHKVALVTDGRFSGATRGPCVGHVSPEAYTGGVIGVLKDDDEILIDIPSRKIEVLISDDEIKKRLRNFVPLHKPAPFFMERYRKMVNSASKGAILSGGE